MRTFIFYYKAYHLGGVMLVQAKDRIRAEQLFIERVRIENGPYMKENIFKRAPTMSWAINYKEVHVQVIPNDMELTYVLFNGDY